MSPWKRSRVPSPSSRLYDWPGQTMSSSVLPTRAQLDRHQVWVYAGAILTGLAVGTAAPAFAPAFEATLWPALGVLLYATFAQVPLVHVPHAFRDVRFMGAVLVGDFVLAPLAVAALLPLAPNQPAVRVGCCSCC